MDPNAADDSLLGAGNPDIGRTSSQSKHPRKPLRLCRLVAHRPRLCFGLTLGLHVLFVALSAGLMAWGFDLFPVDFSTLPLDLRDSTWFRRDLAWRGRFEYKNVIIHHLPADKQTNYWPRANRADASLLLLYDAGEGNNIFTKENLKKMQTIEDKLTNVKDYKNYCQITSPDSSSCYPAISVLRFFDGTLRLLDPVFHDPNFDNIVQVLYKAYTLNVTKGKFMYGLSKDHVINSTYVRVSHTRSIIPLGYPIKGKTYGQTLDECVEFMERDFKPLFEDFMKTKQFTFLYYQENLMIEDGKRQGFQDMKLAIGSVIFIFGFILFHTRSLWITVLGVFSILCSFVETNLIYRLAIGYRYFGFFHVLIMFIILGIGADDLFVFWDAWKASELRHFPSLAHRLDDTYRKSAISMFVTSLTTTLAFLASAISPLLATNSFGVFSAILIVIDYISVITFFPTIVVMHHLYFEKKTCFPCRCRRSSRCCTSTSTVSIMSSELSQGTIDDDDDPLLTDIVEPEMNSNSLDTAMLSLHSNINDDDDSTVTDVESPDITQEPSHNTSPSRNSPGASQGMATNSRESAQLKRNPYHQSLAERQNANSAVSDCCCFSSRKAENETPDPLDFRHCDGEDGTVPDACLEQPEHRWLVLFFKDYYLHCVTHRVWRWVLLAILTLLFVFLAVSASRLQPDNQQVGLFKESHHYTRAFRLASGGFADNGVDSSIALEIMWGVRERDLSPCPFSHYKCRGRAVYDDHFDPSTEAAQRSLLKFCDAMFNLTSKEMEDMKIRRDVITGKPKIRCFIRDLNTFLKNDATFTGSDVSLPWNRSKLENFVRVLKNHYNISDLNQSYSHYLDAATNFWLLDGYRLEDTQSFKDFHSLLGEQRTPLSFPLLPTSGESTGVLVGNRLKFITVMVDLSLHYETLAYREHIPVVHRWERFVKNQLRTMPPEMQGGFQTTEVAWHWLFVQKSLVNNAISGIILGLSLALPILIVSTCNVINGLIASLTICCVTVCVIGVVPLAGWKLGVLVSLNMCLVVGLAVDYVVHLAEGYHMAPPQRARTRKDRLEHALVRMGISVLSGACTTLGASIFMLFAKIQFFYQFGIFMFCTIGFSLLFSLGFYVPLMGILGPEGDVGNILVPFRRCFRRGGCFRFRCQGDSPGPEHSCAADTERSNRRPSAELMMTDEFRR